MYNTAHLAGEFNAYHARCRCRVLPEGAADAVGYDADLFGELYTLDSYLTRSKEDLARRKLMQNLIIEKHTNPDFADSVFANFTYEKGVVDFSEKAYENLLPHEQQTVDTLVNLGYSLKALAESIEDGVKSIDSLMNGEYAEWKNSFGGRRSIERNLDDAIKKWKNRKLSCPIRLVYTNYGDIMDAKQIIKELKNRKGYYDEVLFIGNDGTIHFMKGYHSKR